MGQLIEGLRANSRAWVSGLCAAMMLCFVPLVFRDAFFDINRIKVYSVYACIPAAAVLMLFAWIIHKRGSKRIPLRKDVRRCFISMAVFLSACVASCAFSGFDRSVLLGTEGRSCGLLFLLCCGAAFYLIACGRARFSRMLWLILLCADLIALLGLLNAMGIDPLGFYTYIKKSQRTMYMSTIGHFDFFGTYMVMLLPLAGALFVFSDKRAERCFGLLSALLISLGTAASRTDSALMGVQLACLALFALSGNAYISIARALLVWAVGFVSLPLAGILMKHGAFSITYSGFHAVLCERPIALAASALLIALALLSAAMHKRGACAPGRKKLTALLLAVLCAAAVLLICAILYFTFIQPDAALGAAEQLLRFDDQWGSCRGFVYTRSVKEYMSYSPPEKLFGKGLDTTKIILSAYFDHPVVERVGIFDDAHNQLLQFLLTGGLLTAGAFAAFYLFMLLTLYRCAQEDPLLCGAAASVAAYSVVLLINVTQPILLITYFSLCALALGRVGYLDRSLKRRRRMNG